MRIEMKTENKVDILLKERVDKFCCATDNYDLIYHLGRTVAAYNRKNFGTESPDYTNLTIKDKTFHGWMRVIAINGEIMINGRWDYWLDIRASQEVEGKPIPQLDFRNGNEAECEPVKDMIKDCLSKLSTSNGYKSLELFVDWLLYAWGSSLVTELPSEITDDINKYWYENFKAQYLFAVPCDYFVRIASEVYGNKGFNSTAFYPTPSSVVKMMVEMTYNKEDAEKNKYKKVCEPSVGSGIMLLYQSNHSLRLYGQDIDPLMCKLTILNGYFYMPWAVESDEETNDLLEAMSIKYN